jgi:hypothetical protein
MNRFTVIAAVITATIPARGGACMKRKAEARLRAIYLHPRTHKYSGLRKGLLGELFFVVKELIL